MKLNFWQWLGIVLLIVCGIYFLFVKHAPEKPVTVPATTQTQP